ncbi:MAG: DUF6431 domain-containing protein [Dehalococcoidia bacterium]|nr:DUF6431 domain-containing protein [Dehalococcoidia bacterium]
MFIFAYCGPDVQHYVRQLASLVLPRPKACPQCDASDHLIGHGSYPRTVSDHNEALLIRVKRLLCTICRHTISILPSFCLPYRHYCGAIVQRVLDLRYQKSASWATIRRQFEPSDLPVLSTCRVWVSVFARSAERALATMLEQLAVWQWQPGKLELVLAELAALPKGAAQLIAAVPHLLAWLRENGFAAPEGVGRWLATLTRWGLVSKLGRLV